MSVKETVYIRALTSLVSIIAILYPLTAVPQIYKIWRYKDASGVSLLTWCLFLAFTVPLLLYSVHKKEKRFTLMWSLWAIVYAVVIVGIVLYG